MTAKEFDFDELVNAPAFTSDLAFSLNGLCHGYEAPVGELCCKALSILREQQGMVGLYYSILNLISLSATPISRIAWPIRTARFASGWKNFMTRRVPRPNGGDTRDRFSITKKMRRSI